MAGATAVPSGATKIDADAFEILRLVAESSGGQLAFRVAKGGGATSIVPTGLSAATIAKSASANGTATFGFPVSGLTATVAATFNASATGNLTVQLFGSPDGTAFDDSGNPLTTDLVLGVSAGNAVQKTWALDAGLSALDAIKAIATNDDSSYSVTAVTVTFNWVP